jgi:protein TonB
MTFSPTSASMFVSTLGSTPPGGRDMPHLGAAHRLTAALAVSLAIHAGVMMTGRPAWKIPGTFIADVLQVRLDAPRAPEAAAASPSVATPRPSRAWETAPSLQRRARPPALTSPPPPGTAAVDKTEAELRTPAMITPRPQNETGVPPDPSAAASTAAPRASTAPPMASTGTPMPSSGAPMAGAAAPMEAPSPDQDALALSARSPVRETSAGPPSAAFLEAYGQRISQALGRYREYPQAALLHGWEGLVTLRLRLARSGGLIDAQLHRSSGHEVLDREALAMLRKVDRLPIPPEGLQDGEIVVLVPILFRLEP